MGTVNVKLYARKRWWVTPMLWMVRLLKRWHLCWALRLWGVMERHDWQMRIGNGPWKKMSLKPRSS